MNRLYLNVGWWQKAWVAVLGTAALHENAIEPLSF